jgi:DNA-binding IclR family transcriptional regulator
MLPAQPNQSLIDGMACLQALAIRATPIGVRELARQLGMDRTRTHRLLATLAHLGMAQRDPTRKYSVGPGIHVLAAQCLHASRLLQWAADELQALQRFGYTTALGVMWTDQVSYLFHADPGIPWAAALGRLALFPASLSGLGLAVLAQMSDQQVRELYSCRPIPGFDNRISSLLEALQATRKRGYAIGMPAGRSEPDRSIGVALHCQPNAAIALSGDIPARQVRPIAAALIRAGKTIDARSSSSS